MLTELDARTSHGSHTVYTTHDDWSRRLFVNRTDYGFVKAFHPYICQGPLSLSLRRRFAEVWESEAAKPEAKERIIRTVIEEIFVNLNDETEKLTFPVHRKGGTHAQ